MKGFLLTSLLLLANLSVNAGIISYDDGTFSLSDNGNYKLDYNIINGPFSSVGIFAIREANGSNGIVQYPLGIQYFHNPVGGLFQNGLNDSGYTEFKFNNGIMHASIGSQSIQSNLSSPRFGFFIRDHNEDYWYSLADFNNGSDVFRSTVSPIESDYYTSLYRRNGNSVSINLSSPSVGEDPTKVPEPASILLLFFGFLLLFVKKNRSHKSL